MKKRGMSHIEVITAFIIFIAAVSFTLYYFNPARVPKVSDALLSYSNEEIQRNVSVPVITYAVKLNDSVDKQQEKKCWGDKSDRKVAINLSFQIPEGMNIRIENLSGPLEIDDYNIKKQQSDIICVRLDKKDSNKITFGDFIFIHVSEDLEPARGITDNPSSPNYACPSKGINQITLDDSCFQVATVYERKVISEKRTEKLRDEYRNNYETTRDRLKIPRTIDFAFNLAIPKTNVSAAKNISSGSEVFAVTKKKEVLAKDTNFTFGDLTVRIW